MTLASAKGAVVAVLVALVLVHGSSGTPGAAPAGPTAGASADSQVVARAVAAHGCSATGFEAGSAPASALIRTDAGQLRQVPFDEGWDVYRGVRPGTLIAVCLDQP